MCARSSVTFPFLSQSFNSSCKGSVGELAWQQKVTVTMSQHPSFVRDPSLEKEKDIKKSNLMSYLVQALEIHFGGILSPGLPPVTDPDSWNCFRCQYQFLIPIRNKNGKSALHVPFTYLEGGGKMIDENLMPMYTITFINMKRANKAENNV